MVHCNRYRVNIFSLFSAISLFAFLFLSENAIGQSSMPSSPSKPIKELLNSDGTLNLKAGFSGSLDPAGYRMVTGQNGEPKFVSMESITSASDNVYWERRFSVEDIQREDEESYLHVYCIAVSGTDVYVGGRFRYAGGSGARNIAKWNGRIWSPLGSGIDGTVQCLAVSGTDVYAGGYFTTAGSTSAKCIAKWNGSSWSALGSGINNTVNALAVSGSNIYAGGPFTTAGGVSASRIARWDGSTWSALGTGVDSTVLAIAVGGSYIYVGGYFTTAGGVTVNKIARWSGSSWSALGTGVNNNVYSIAVSGTDVYASGTFTTAGGVSANRIAKWNGSNWSALGTGLNSYADAIAVNGTDVYACGGITNAGGVPVNYIAKWNGSNWSALGNGITGSPAAWPPSSKRGWALAFCGTDLYFGGDFSAVDGILMSSIAIWNGSMWHSVGSGTDGEINALCVIGTDVYAGGSFITAGGDTVNNVAKWNNIYWSPLGSGINGTVCALATDGVNLIAGGAFTTAGGVAANRIAQWNGSTWSALGSGMNSTVYALAVSGTNIYAGGNFTTAGGVSANRIAMWNGSSWSAFGSGVNSAVRAIAINGSDVYIGGWFSSGGVSYIAKWNGSTWSALGSGTNAEVYALAFSGSDLYVGGDFSTAGGITAYGKARWDGSSWSSNDVPSGPRGGVNALAVYGNSLYIGGIFDDGYIEPYYHHIAQWDARDWSHLGTGVNYTVSAFAVLGNCLYVGGAFTKVGVDVFDNSIGYECNYFVIWTKSPSAAAVTKTFTTPTTGVVSFDDSENETAVDIEISSSSGGTTMLINRYEDVPLDSSSISGTVGHCHWIIQQTGLASSFTTNIHFNLSQIPFSGVSDPNAVVLYYRATPGRGTFSALTTTVVAGEIVLSGTSSFGEYALGITNPSHPDNVYWDGDFWNGLNNIARGVGLRPNATGGNDVIVGGDFTAAGEDTTADYIACWDGSDWSNVGGGVNYGVRTPVVKPTGTTSGDVYVGGAYLNAGGLAGADYIARWNGSTWNALGTGTNGIVWAVAICGNDVYVGGTFTLAGGVANTARIARWNGSSWNALGTGLNNTVYAIAIGPNGSGGVNVYAGGDFSNAGGDANADRIAYWNGSSWIAMGTGATGIVRAISVNGTDVYVGGTFASVGGVANTGRIARWDGSAWNALGSGLTTAVYALAVSGTEVYAGGDFTNAGTIPDADKIARWDGSSWNTLGSGMFGRVYGLVVNGNDLCVGGDFSRAGDKPSYYYARWFKPVSAAAVTKGFSTPTSGVISFNETSNVTAVRMDVSSSSGGATILVNRYEDAPQNVSGITGNVSQYRWIIQQTGLAPSCTANVRFRISEILLNGILDPDLVVVCWRPNPGRGSFSPLTTSYDGSNNDIVATGVSSFGEFVFGSSDPLAAEIVGLSAVSAGASVELSWSTVTEVSNFGFEIERRSMTTSSSTWKKIDFVQGAGTSNSTRNYLFIEKTVAVGRHVYRLKQIDQDGMFKYSQSVEVEVLGIPRVFALEQNYPNPFNPTTTIEFTLPEDSKVLLKVYDMLGREVTTLVNEDLKAGTLHQATFDASKLSTGMYIYRLQAGNDMQVKKLVLLK